MIEGGTALKYRTVLVQEVSIDMEAIHDYFVEKEKKHSLSDDFDKLFGAVNKYIMNPREELKPEYEPYIKTLTPKKDNKSKKTNNTKKNKQTIRSKVKVVTYIVIGFSIMFAVCYRNAQIDEKFSKVQSLKQEMSNMDKQNAPLIMKH